MAGRGDNNKHGSAGRGADNQSNQPFIAGGEQEIHTKDDDRLTSVPERSFDLVVDQVPYLVKVAPFNFNDEQRYYISINGGVQHVFTWDDNVSALRAIDDDAAALPSSVEDEISRRLIAG